MTENSAGFNRLYDLRHLLNPEGTTGITTTTTESKKLKFSAETFYN